MSDECARKGKWIGGCRFEPRYDVSEPIVPVTLRSATRFDPQDWTRRSYVADVCTTCGKVVSRLDTNR